MKKMIIFIAIAMLSLPGFSQKTPLPTDKKATKETVKLFQAIWKRQQKGIMYGHQDDLMYGHQWWYEKDRSDTKDFTGDYPAVAGFELGHIELGNERSLDSVSFTQITEQVKAHYKRRGIITISWHLDNPFTGKTAWDVSSKEVVGSILPGGKNHEIFNGWLDKLATYFNTFVDDKGIAIPFIFRPFHEHSGSFFWWGNGICTDKEYIDLWRYTVEYLQNKKEIHNILYAYNTDRVTSLEQYLQGYPGDDIIDMLSIDMYDRGPQFDTELDAALKFVTETGITKKKLTALSETGERRGMTDWWSKVLLPIVSKYPVAYVLTWRNTYYKNAGKWKVPEKAFPDDFLNFYRSPRTLFLKEIKQ